MHVVRCSMFVVECLLLLVFGCLLSPFVVCVLFVVRGLWFVGCCSLFGGVRCLGVVCSLLLDCFSFVVVRCCLL